MATNFGPMSAPEHDMDPFCWAIIACQGNSPSAASPLVAEAASGRDTPHWSPATWAATTGAVAGRFGVAWAGTGGRYSSEGGVSS